MCTKVEIGQEQCSFVKGTWTKKIWYLWSEEILRQLNVLTRVIIGGHNLKRYANDTVFMADTKRKLHEIMKIVKKVETKD